MPRTDLTSPKRGKSERSGIHAWHPYYAGFSAGFVADILSDLKVRSNQIVFDPMNGSGTTTLVAQQLGFLSIGTELNPAMAIIARAKDSTFLELERLVERAAEVANRAARQTWNEVHDEHCAAWFSPEVFKCLKQLDAEIMALGGKALLPLDKQFMKAAPAGADQQGGRIQDILRAALLITARIVSTAEDSKNPTWLKPGATDQTDDIDVFMEFRQVVARMRDDICEAFDGAPKTRRVLAIEADARDLPLPARCVKAIVTSPPYLTRIDYAVGTAPELVVLGYEKKEEVRNLRREIMGSTCVTGGSYDWNECWGPTCLDTLDLVRQHPSKASSGYYLKMHVQYFRDAEAILRECLRVLKPGASAIFVVQDSWYKDIHIALDRIYNEMAIGLGAKKAETICSEHVRNHLGLVNTRSRQYDKGAIHEHVLLIQKR